MVLNQPMRQADFGALVGISQQAVSDLLRNGTLEGDATGAQWLLAYCHRLREQAAGRLGSQAGGLDLAQERAALAREQREGIAINNAIKRGEYASVQVLAKVLATASQAVVQRMDHAPGELRRRCPDLPPEAIDTVMDVLASARNEWLRQTADLMARAIDDLTAEDPEEAADAQPAA